MTIVHQQPLPLFEGKTCLKCRLWLPLAAYSKATARPDGMQPYCKACNKIQRQPAVRSQARTCEWCHAGYLDYSYGTTRFCGATCYGAWQSTQRRPLTDRFWEKVQKTDGCWLWIGRINNKGYGEFSVGGHRGHYVFAHRLSYEWANGPIPDGMDICHVCDCPPCIRPDHLFLGSRADNMADAVSKDRMARGERQPHSVLTDALVSEIRTRAAAGETHTSLAELFGVSRATVSLLVERKTWKHVA